MTDAAEAGEVGEHDYGAHRRSTQNDRNSQMSDMGRGLGRLPGVTSDINMGISCRKLLGDRYRANEAKWANITRNHAEQA